MIPQPKKIKRTEGTAPQGSLAEERICPGLGGEEYRISISAGKPDFSMPEPRWNN